MDETNTSEQKMSPSNLNGKRVPKQRVYLIAGILVVLVIILLSVFFFIKRRSSTIQPTSLIQQVEPTIPQEHVVVQSDDSHLHINTLDSVSFLGYLQDMQVLSPVKMTLPSATTKDDIQIDMQYIILSVSSFPAPAGAHTGLVFPTIPVSAYTQSYNVPTHTLAIHVYIDSQAIAKNPNSLSYSGLTWVTLIQALQADSHSQIDIQKYAQNVPFTISYK